MDPASVREVKAHSDLAIRIVGYRHDYYYFLSPRHAFADTRRNATCDHGVA